MNLPRITPQKLSAEEVIALMESEEFKDMARMFPEYKDGAVLYDLQTLAKFAEETPNKDKAARLASTMLVRVLPLIIKEIEADKKVKVKGTFWFDGLVVCAGFGALLYLLMLAGVVQIVL